MIVPVIIIIISVFLLVGAIRNDQRIMLPIQMCILFAILTTGAYNFDHNVHLVFWLCNITAILGLILTFQFRQKLFEVFFYFAWTGDLFTIMIWPNPVCPPLETNPIAWAGFILKHTAPLTLSVFFIKRGKFLTENAIWTSLKFMLIYAIIMVIYNQIFDQNILDFRYPTLDFERQFGEWPGFVVVNLIITLIWYYLIHVITTRLKLIKQL